MPIHQMFFQADQSRTILEWLTTALFLSGYIPYIVALLRRHVRPVLSMWIVWVLVDVVVLFGMVQKGEDVSQIGAATCGATTIALLTLFLRTWRPGWTWTESLCAISALLGIVAFLVLPEANWHILIPSVAMGVAGIPAILSAWHDYRNEGFWGWALWSASCIPAMLIVHFFDGWSVASAAQKLSFLLFDTLIMSALILSRIQVWLGYKTLPGGQTVSLETTASST